MIPVIAAKECYVHFYQCFGQVSYSTFIESHIETYASLGGFKKEVLDGSIWCRNVPDWFPRDFTVVIGGAQCTFGCT